MLIYIVSSWNKYLLRLLLILLLANNVYATCFAYVLQRLHNMHQHIFLTL